MLGGDVLLVETVAGGCGRGVDGDTGTEDLGNVLRGQEVTNVFVESATTNAEATDLFLHEFGEGDLVKISVLISEEDSFDEGFDLVGPRGGSIVESCFANCDPIGQESSGVTALEIFGHLGEN